MNYVNIKAKHLREGDVLCYAHTGYTLTVDEVEFTRDGEVLIRVGEGGTGTEFYDMNDNVQILPRYETSLP